LYLYAIFVTFIFLQVWVGRTSGARHPAEGRINCVAPYKSLQGYLYPLICAMQTVPAQL